MGYGFCSNGLQVELERIFTWKGSERAIIFPNYKINKVK